MIECMMIDLLMHKSMMFTSESGKGVLLPFVWAEYLDATTATPVTCHGSNQHTN